jgi:acetyl-CoA carboxylase biotin carboxyl carrier protein
MMGAAELADLVRRLQASGVTFYELEGPSERLRLHLAASAPLRAEASAQTDPVDDSPPQSTAASPIRAPHMGYLRLSHRIGGVEKEVIAGEPVIRGQLLAFLDAGGILLPVEADRDGLIGQVLAEEGALVGYGTPLFTWA